MWRPASRYGSCLMPCGCRNWPRRSLRRPPWPRWDLQRSLMEEQVQRIWLAAAFLTSASSGTLAVLPLLAGEWADHNVLHAHYDGVTNDLLTAGLGKSGLGSPIPPGFADPLKPTAEELRRLAIYSNYRALVDPTLGGGYGLLYGPTVPVDGGPVPPN